MKAITDSKASEAQASSFMDQSEVKPAESEETEVSIKELNLDNLDFLIELPIISAVDLDVLKLTAQFAAKNGKQFILHLSQKESRNPQFDFLKPHNHLHSFYQALVKQYALVINPPAGLLERVKRCAFNKSEHLRLVQKRAQIERLERARIQEEEAAEDAEREAFSKIDWNDFTIAETVTFGPEDHHKDFPAPLNPQALKTMPINERLEMWTGVRRADALEPVAIENPDEEEEMEIDEPNDNDAFAAPLITANTAVRPSNEIIMGAAFGTSGAPIKVRTDYVPRGNQAPAAAITQICEICKAAVPVSQIDEHIRIELLDPKWRTQRLAMMSKNRESNLVETGTDVSRNLEALAKHRSDIFSSSAGSTATSIERGPTRPIWDGRSDSVGHINRAAQILAKPQIEKEMEALQRSGDYSLDPSRGIGPRLGNNAQLSGHGSGQAYYPQMPNWYPPQGQGQAQGYPPYPQVHGQPQGYHPNAYPQAQGQGYPSYPQAQSQGYPPYPHPPFMPPPPPLPAGFNPAMFPQIPFPPPEGGIPPPPKDEKKQDK